MQAASEAAPGQPLAAAAPEATAIGAAAAAQAAAAAPAQPGAALPDDGIVRVPKLWLRQFLREIEATSQRPPFRLVQQLSSSTQPCPGQGGSATDTDSTSQVSKYFVVTSHVRHKDIR